MNTRFVFVHGWGAKPAFWDGLLTVLPDIEATKIDLGFIGEDQVSTDEPLSPSVFVTHSLGTMWALKNHYPDIDMLISINGFGCFRHFVDERTLQTMQKRLERNPSQQMKEFRDMCAMPHYDDNLNIERLQEGLEWLRSWDMDAELSALEKPVLSLMGQHDPLLPLDRMEQEWAGYDMRICESGGHALPLTDAQWCAYNIKDFLGGI